MKMKYVKRSKMSEVLTSLRDETVTLSARFKVFVTKAPWSSYIRLVRLVCRVGEISKFKEMYVLSLGDVEIREENFINERGELVLESRPAYVLPLDISDIPVSAIETLEAGGVLYEVL